MRPRTEHDIRWPRRTSALLCAIPCILLACGGCGLLAFPTDIAGIVQDANEPQIVADVSAVSPDTGLPTQLSGAVSGEYAGRYDEEILEVYFDGSGVPIAALSRSVLTLDTPDTGTLISINLIVVLDFVFATDDQGTPILDDLGAPIAIGLISASTGEIISGTGAFEGATGELHSNSTIMLVGGELGLGTLDSTLTLTLDQNA
ncbi:MAG: hypothetical protein IID33_01405, partial [Planctomycetes bacterium]|nr:hypothetical protein [Planctomycetota bacterium]